MTLPHREVYLPDVHKMWSVEGEAKNYDLILVARDGTESKYRFDRDEDKVRKALSVLEDLGYGVYIEKARDAKPREHRPEDKQMELVTFETYDELFDNETSPRLIEFHLENRMVYSNSKGRFIKTRGHGNVRLTQDGPALVQFQWIRGRYGRILRAVPPERKI